ncbi:tRNA (adenosine(37)-N6)-threonylcarbamoyltransferase complex ATPase subunit type 1 TsaE [Pseudopedobacter sp.]|uniref:tRNA (adenosine(37)-N6)-threonylcarbamoyltransferase complex ATPase subunit type 1 TsaE n=1 Tax=Pseudopedobacter sp. TaxID=1936787 RepID=UPI00333EE431
MQISTKSLNDLDNAAKQVLSFAEEERIFVFYGEMGAGKTTLISKLCYLLGTEDHTSSPTFSIVNEYETKANGKIYHFDFYRIKNQGEAFDLGYEDYFYSGEYCMIEWPEKIPDLLPDSYIAIEIKTTDENSREITLSKNRQG